MRLRQTTELPYKKQVTGIVHAVPPLGGIGSMAMFQCLVFHIRLDEIFNIILVRNPMESGFRVLKYLLFGVFSGDANEYMPCVSIACTVFCTKNMR